MKKLVAYIIVLLALLIVSIGVRSYGAIGKPLWLDEVEHLYDTLPDYSFDKVITEAAGHAQPPFDHLILWKFRQKVSAPEFVRVPYLIYSIIFCVLIWIWASRLNSLFGLIATGGWLAVSSFHIYYAQEVRMYGLMIMLAAAYFLLLDLALRTRSLWLWLCCLIVAVMNLYTNIFASVTVAFSGIYVVSYSLVSWYEKRKIAKSPEKKRVLFLRIINLKKWPDIIKWMIIVAIAAAVFYPVYHTYIAENLRNHQEWEQGGKGVFSFYKSIKTVFIDFAAKPKGRLNYIWYFIILVCAGVVPKRLKEIPMSLMAIFMLLVYPLIIAFMFSEKSNVLFKTRYVSQAFPFFVIALGAGIVHISCWLAWLLGKVFSFLRKEKIHQILMYIFVFTLTGLAIAVEMPATKSIIKMEKSPWLAVVKKIKRYYDEQHLITSQLDVAFRWNLHRYLGGRTNWKYVGLEELPKLFFEGKRRLWIVVDKRKLRIDLKKVGKDFEVTEIDSFYPSIYLFKSKREMNFTQLINTIQPFAKKMDAYAVITMQQYIYYGKARRAVKNHDFNEARSDYQKGLNIGFKKDIWINLEFARFLKEYKHYKEAAKQYEEFFNNAAPQHKKTVVLEMIENYDAAGMTKKADAMMKKYGTKKMSDDRKVSQYTRAAIKSLKSENYAAAYTNYLNALTVSPSNAVFCRRLAEICFYKMKPNCPLEAYEWNKKASDYMLAKDGIKYIEADFNNAMIQTAIGRTNTAVNLYTQLLNYLNTEQPSQSNWLYKAYIYRGVINEKKDYLKETLTDFENAAKYATTPEEKASVSNHLSRIRKKLKIDK